jgi:hypothetical protein
MEIRGLIFKEESNNAPKITQRFPTKRNSDRSSTAPNSSCVPTKQSIPKLTEIKLTLGNFGGKYAD